jgi:hypothetical protein
MVEVYVLCSALRIVDYLAAEPRSPAVRLNDAPIRNAYQMLYSVLLGGVPVRVASRFSTSAKLHFIRLEIFHTRAIPRHLRQRCHSTTCQQN